MPPIVTRLCVFLWLGREARAVRDICRNRALAIGGAVR
jgi:hypothetical protein